ncbi:hypothetical protein [Nostoc sp.]|uniref:hypothetical protein n=1 Tax=Nostoc sp. TaxID=1180 RepID=UPI002FF955C4
MLNRIYGNPSSPAEEYDGDERINMVKAIAYGQLFLAESDRKLHKYLTYSGTCTRIAIASETRSKFYLFVKNWGDAFGSSDIECCLFLFVDAAPTIGKPLEHNVITPAKISLD